MEGSSSEKQNLLTKSQFMFTIFGSIVGTGVLSLPNDVVKIAHQDGWISILIGGVYPLYIVMVGSYLSKKFPNDTILILSKKYLGYFFGNILNLIFLTSFIYFATMIASSYINLIRNFATEFLTSLKMIIITFLIVSYAAAKGLKVIGKASEIAFYIILTLILLAMPALNIADITNIYPIFDVGLMPILQGSITSIFAYSGAEIMLLICPFMKEKNKVFSSSLIIIAVVVAVYVWVVFITIYYLGPDIVTKSYWSFLLVTESVTLTVINNYRYIFIFLWILIAFKSCTIYCYASVYILKDFIKKVEIKKLYFFMYPLFVYLTFKFGNEISRQKISKYATQVYAIFNLLYMTVIAAIVFFKRGDIR